MLLAAVLVEGSNMAAKQYVVSSPRMTVWVKTDGTKLNRITDTAPITRKFINQPFDNLKNWLADFGGLRVTQILNWHKVLVCGGRDYPDKSNVFQTLDCYHKTSQIELLIHGDAPGADSIADEWAEFREVPCAAYPADWKKHGKAAGPIRNAQMLREEKPDLVLAFPGGRGTANMISLAKKAGVPVHEIS